jgi:integrase/recombinase XerD
MTTAQFTALDGQLRGYLDHLTIERGVAANTISSYRRDLRRYGEHLNLRGIDDLRAVTETDVSDFLVALRRGDPDAHVTPLSAVSAARALIAVRGLHKFASAEGIIDIDVARAVKPPTPSRRLPKSLTLDEVLALLDGAGGDGPNDGPLTLRNRALLELLYSTGARISEAVGLDVDDVDTQARSVLLRGKGGKQRLVPVGRPAIAALDAYLVRGRPDLARRGRGMPGLSPGRSAPATRSSPGRSAPATQSSPGRSAPAPGGPAIFLNARGGRLSRQSAWQVLQDAAERAGISAAVSPHTLRHSFATHLLDGGADVRVVQELLGHASVTTTQIYTLVTVTALREVWAGAHPRA